MTTSQTSGTTSTEVRPNAPAMRPTVMAAAAAVAGCLAMGAATKAYDGDANIRIDIFVNGVIIAVVLVTAALATAARLLHVKRGGGRGAATLQKALGVALIVVLFLFAMALVGQMVDPGTPIWAKALNVVTAAACAVTAIRLLRSHA